MVRGHSRRAEILMKLLQDINTGNYTECEGHIVFGASSAVEVFEDLARSTGEREDPSFWDAVTKFLSDFKVHCGRKQVAERVSLGQAPRFKSDALDVFSPADILRLRSMIEGVLPGVQTAAQRSRTAPDASDEDSIDAAITVELLGKLPEAVRRAADLDQMSLERVPDKDLRRYFEEAHGCYLYGFNVACAVLCRAILESALESVCDSKGIVRKQVPRGESYFELLVKEASRGGLLTDDRPSCAMKVRNAGNYAIHDVPKFERCWECRMGEILDDTRKVLIDLCAS